ncbi:MAG TPA: nuclear transport factor 2 family protein [Dehalococcoidia bacterium]|nr:nuclear transport factor 2 family protein [Dehalococcoidia bacterium]
MTASSATEPMTHERAQAFARRWAEEWNRKDVEAVLAHFAEEVEFTSPKAAATVGAATVRGKDALRAYWNAAIARIETIQFTIDHAVWDPASAALLIVYTAAINGQSNRAGELLQLNAAALAVRGEAFYGAALD